MAPTTLTPVSPPAVFLPAPFHLQEAKVSLIDQDRCEKFYIPHPAIPPDQAVTVQEDMLCAGDTNVEKGICRVSDAGKVSTLWVSP